MTVFLKLGLKKITIYPLSHSFTIYRKIYWFVTPVSRYEWHGQILANTQPDRLVQGSSSTRKHDVAICPSRSPTIHEHEAKRWEQRGQWLMPSEGLGPLRLPQTNTAHYLALPAPSKQHTSSFGKRERRRKKKKQIVAWVQPPFVYFQSHR